jgi:hypothetical protein
MKFLCVPCDTAMKLRDVAPPDRGSLSIVYTCPACGYEMAMLTNAYETQAVQSLGVKIGPGTPGEASALGRESGLAGATAQAGKCPFPSMIPAAEPRPDANSVRWTPAAEARLANIPEFVRPMAKTGIERFALERGAMEVDEQILDAAKEFFGM